MELLNKGLTSLITNQLNIPTGQGAFSTKNNFKLFLFSHFFSFFFLFLLFLDFTLFLADR